MIRAVVFDLDGVLVDAVEWHYLALNRALSLFGYPIRSEEHATLYNGLPTSVKLELLSQRKGFPRSLHPFVHEMKQRYTQQILASSVAPDPKMTQILSFLKAHGYRLAVATNSVRATLDLILDRMEIRDFFDFTLSNQDVAHPKPSPEIYFRCVQQLGVRPEETLIIEDSLPGITAARQVSSHVVIVRGPQEVTLDLIESHLGNPDKVKLQGAPDPKKNLLGGRLEVVVPMAGIGQRFQVAGYGAPKPFIDIFGLPMIRWVIDNITPTNQESHFTFLCSERHAQDLKIQRLLNEAAPGCDIVAVPSTTQGAACTVCLAMDRVDASQPLLIANSDQWVDVSIDGFLHTASRTQCDGLIMTFPATDRKWSYARLDPGGRVVEVAEKEPISHHATVGIYYFKNGRDFFDAAQEMVRKEIRTNGEFYVCPTYNELITRGMQIRTFPIEAAAMHGLGTPEDLEAFIQWNLSRAGQSAVPLDAPHSDSYV